LSLQCRLEQCTKEFLDAVESLQNNNNAKIILEFGLQTIIPDEMKVIGRINNIRKIERLLNEEIHPRKLWYEISIIYGLPLQTLDSFQTTIEWIQNRTLKPYATIRAFPLMILRGTGLDSVNIKEQFSLIEDANLANEVFLNEANIKQQNVDYKRQLSNIPHVISSNTFTRNDWIKMCKIAYSLT